MPFKHLDMGIVAGQLAVYDQLPADLRERGGCGPEPSE